MLKPSSWTKKSGCKHDIFIFFCKKWNQYNDLAARVTLTFKTWKLIFAQLNFSSLCFTQTAHDDYTRIGLWVIGGILTFLIVEKTFMDEESGDEITTECNGLSNGTCQEVRKVLDC